MYFPDDATVILSFASDVDIPDPDVNDVVSATFWGVTAVNDTVVTPSLCICPTAVPTVLMVKLLLLNVPADVVSSIPAPSISFNADTFVVPAWSFNIIS